MTVRDTNPFREGLAHRLRAAMKARDAIAVAAIRSAMAAIDNAEAVDASRAPVPQHPLGARGLGAGDVPRHALTVPEMRDIVRSEVSERRRAAAEYEDVGQLEAAARLRAEASVLEETLADDEP